tara:strand:- start:55 stop:288 length:234 start_codon:yes stop_codon:yes gene_type:complete
MSISNEEQINDLSGDGYRIGKMLWGMIPTPNNAFIVGTACAPGIYGALLHFPDTGRFMIGNAGSLRPCVLGPVTVLY